MLPLFLYVRNIPLEFTLEITTCYLKYLQCQVFAINRIQLGWLNLYILCQWKNSMRLNSSLIILIFFSKSMRPECLRVLGTWRKDADELKQREGTKGDTCPSLHDSNPILLVGTSQFSVFSYSSSNPSANPVESPFKISRIWPLLTISTATIQFKPILSLP